MATVNYSVPDEVRERFNRTFAGRNKSRIIADLMLRAVEEEERQARRDAAIRRIVARRSERPAVTDAEIRAARQASRP